MISSYDENAVRLRESEKQAALEAARQYNQELFGKPELLDPFSPIKKEVDERYQSLLNTNAAGMMGVYSDSKDGSGAAHVAIRN